MATINAPVWKNTDKLVSWTESPYTYNIVMKGSPTNVTVFTGKAWVRPGDEYMYINVNSIAQNYLTSDLPDLRNVTATTSYTNTEACKQFYFVHNNVTSDTYNFLLNYSYEDVNMSTNHSLSEPINGHGRPGMFFISSMFSASSLSVVTTLSISGGSSYDETHCGNYALYYLNPHGGWDSFLIEGNVTQTDTYKRYQMNVSVDNTSQDFGKKTYNNETTPSWSLCTGILTDAQAKILTRNLLSTPKAYLHDLVNDIVYPVNIKDNSGVYKTYRNQGRKKVMYQINVEAAQNRINVIK